MARLARQVGCVLLPLPAPRGERVDRGAVARRVRGAHRRLIVHRAHQQMHMVGHDHERQQGDVVALAGPFHSLQHDRRKVGAVQQVNATIGRKGEFMRMVRNINAPGHESIVDTPDLTSKSGHPPVSKIEAIARFAPDIGLGKTDIDLVVELVDGSKRIVQLKRTAAAFGSQAKARLWNAKALKWAEGENIPVVWVTSDPANVSQGMIDALAESGASLLQSGVPFH